MASEHSRERGRTREEPSVSVKLLSWTRLRLRKFRALVPSFWPSSNLGTLARGGDAASTDFSNTQSSPSSSRRIYEYDVFISFRGTDTRNNFTDHLHAHLIRKGIFAFKDDRMLEEGQPIRSQLLKAIENSRVSIIVFSKDYAASHWCLEEMAAIVDCQKTLNQTVLSVFYDVDPSDVRNQKGVYQTAFLLHAERSDFVAVYRWKRAMMSLASSVGWDVRDKPESEVIEKIVQKVIKTLDHKFSGFADDLIGIQPRVEELEKLLQLSSGEDDGSQVLGIWGMDGIGKTTHATVLYNRISYLFDACCFVENVSKIYRDGGATAVQSQILRQTLDEKNLKTYGPSEISGIISNRLSHKKVLIVLDNIDDSDQIKELAISSKLFKAGSRIIITTRDKAVLRECEVNVVYEVPLLNNNDARELFCRKAFKSDDPSRSCLALIPEVLKYAQNLPLAIRVVGSFLYARDVIQWRATLDGLQNNPSKKIMKVLQISFDGLELREREIFLHIACFFKGEREDYVRRILDCCGLSPNIGIPLIIEKSLITIRNHEIHMHEMLQDLGKQIVQEEFPQRKGLWSRLWLYEDLLDVMRSETGTSNVQAIVLDKKEDISGCNPLRAEELSKMKGLRLLILYHENFLGSLNFLSNCLQYLLWHDYPFTSLPPKFQPDTLVELNMPHSNIERLWKGIKYLPRLKRVDLSNSECLIETPNFEGVPKLERLDLTGCTNLSGVHPSVRQLEELAFLSLRNCSSLVCLDLGSESRLGSLKVLYLSGCTKLENTLDFRGLSNLEYLDLEQCTSLSAVHESVGALAKLKFLSLRHCINLVRIPNRINAITSLVTLDLCGCLKLENLPLGPTFESFSFLKSLISLDAGFCNLSEVPRAIGYLKCLERLNLEGNNFSSVPTTTAELSSLAYLNLSHCQELRYFPELPSRNASSVGRYFETVSGARNHRSGLYVFNCPNLLPPEEKWAISWLEKLVSQPRHFRCGFDIVIPPPASKIRDGSKIPEWFNHQFKGDSIIRIVDSDVVGENCIGFAFCVAFKVNYPSATSGSSSSALPHSFYLSFESEDTEESFDMPLSLDMDKVVGSKYLWLIYISQPHCHFVKTGAHITFKARPGLNIREWGLRVVSNSDLGCHVSIDPVRKSYSSSLWPKIQLSYNWLVIEEEENENMAAKEKENNLANVGLYIDQPL